MTRIGKRTCFQTAAANRLSRRGELVERSYNLLIRHDQPAFPKVAMTIKFHTAVLCSVSVLLAACGGSSNDTAAARASAQAPVLAARVQASTSAAATAYYTAVQQVYVAYFGRPADADGLVYFATSLRDAGAPTDLAALAAAYANPSVAAIIDVFGNSAESAALYPGDAGVFIEAVYQNLFGRAADAAGKAYWVGLLNDGKITRASAAVSIMSGAQGSDVTVINKKTAVAAQFTTTASSTAGKRAYDGLAANAIVRAMLANVTLATDTSAIQPTLDSTLATLVAARPAAGMYAGTLNNGTLYNMFVADDDSYYGFYSAGATAPIAATGLLYGAGKSSAGSYSAAVTDFNAQAGTAPYALTGTYSAQASFNGSIKAGSTTFTLTTAVIDPAIYDYYKPAVIADVVGSWSMRQTGVAAQAITIAADGSFTGSSTGCAISGQLKPHSNKNAFDVIVNFGAGSCPLSAKSIGGVAFSYTLNAGVTRQLYMAGSTGDHSAGALLVGTNAIVAGQPTALVVTDTLIGTGAVVSAGKTITVKYAGYLYDATAVNLHGTEFDSSDWHSPNTFSFVLGAGQVIAGWDQGFNGMKVGGKRTLIIPSSLGYGTTGSGSIPANAGMVFDVELISTN